MYIFVWTTRYREPSIDGRVAPFLDAFLPPVAQQERASILELGIVSDHVHLLVLLHPTTSLPRLVQRLKGGSAVLANREGHAPRGCPLHRAKGYNVETVSPKRVSRVREYIRNQPRHHPEPAIGDAPVA
jgi:putative transposase